MTQEQILHEIQRSEWQPKFEYSTNLDAVVRAINEPHEDNFLGLDSKVKEIIEREINFAQNTIASGECIVDNNEIISGNYTDNYEITFADVCNWQKELFQHKMSIINFHYNKSNYATICPEDLTDEEEDSWYDEQKKHTDIYVKSKGLPNNFIKLGLRQTNVEVGQDKWKFFDVDGFEKFFTNFNEMKTFSAKHTPIPTPENWWSNYEKINSKWTPPHPMFLEDLKSMCFPIRIGEIDNYRRIINGNKNWICTNDDSANFHLTYWYKIFETTHFLQDLNGRLGGIIINILSHILTGKYLCKSI